MSTMRRLSSGALAPFDWAHLSLLPLLAPSIRVEDYIATRYADGILEISAKVGETPPAAKEIPIKVEPGKKN